MACVFAPRHLHFSTCTLRMPPEVSLPIPMHAHTASLKVQLLIRTSSQEIPIVLPSMPRPLLSEMQSSRVSNSHPSIKTFLHESTSIPSAPLFTITLRNVTFLQYTGCVDHMSL